MVIPDAGAGAVQKPMSKTIYQTYITAANLARTTGLPSRLFWGGPELSDLPGIYVSI